MDYCITGKKRFLDIQPALLKFDLWLLLRRRFIDDMNGSGLSRFVFPHV